MKDSQIRLYSAENDDDYILKQQLGWDTAIISTTFQTQCEILFLPQIYSWYRSISFWLPQNYLLLYIILY